MSIGKSARKAKGSGHLRRDEILEAAKRIFREAGYEGATVRKIAAAVGVSSTAIYLHFPDKRAMLTEIAASAIGDLVREGKAAAQQPMDAAERLRGMLKGYIRFGLKNQSTYDVIFCEAPAEITGRQDKARELGVQCYQTFVAVVMELARQGRLRQEHPHLVAQTLWAGCHGLIALQISNPEFGWMNIDNLVESMVDTLMHGALKEQGIPPKPEV